MPTLVVRSGKQEGVELEAVPGLILGRRPELSFHLDDSKASREHAQIDIDGARFVIVDLKSTNGTFLDGNRVSRGRLRHGSRIRIGRTELEFLDPTANAEPKPARMKIDLGGPAPKRVNVILKATKSRRDRLR